MATNAEIPEVLQWMARSLLDADVVDLVRAAGDRPVEVRLYANRGKVRRRPSVLVGVGQVDEVSVDGA